jgi:hypothetical protein
MSIKVVDTQTEIATQNTDESTAALIREGSINAVDSGLVSEYTASGSVEDIGVHEVKKSSLNSKNISASTRSEYDSSVSCSGKKSAADSMHKTAQSKAEDSASGSLSSSKKTAIGVYKARQLKNTAQDVFTGEDLQENINNAEKDTRQYVNKKIGAKTSGAVKKLYQNAKAKDKAQGIDALVNAKKNSSSSSKKTFDNLSKKVSKHPQSVRNFIESVKTRHKAAKAAKAAITTAAKSGGVLAKLAAGGLPVLLVILALIGLIVVVCLLSFFMQQQTSYEGLDANETAIAQYLKAKGLDNVHIAAVMGNFKKESSCDPHKLQGGDELDEMPSYCTEPGNSTGYGLAQWTSSGRCQGLLDCATRENKSTGDINVQLDFFWEEFESRVDEFNSQSSVEDATRWFHNDYERSADGEEQIQQRVNYAKEYYSKLQGGGGSLLSAAAAIADDDSIGYSQSTRCLNPNVDCSSFVYYSLLESGVGSIDQLGSSPFSSSNEIDALQNVGFERHDFGGSEDDLSAGDILISSEHTEIYAGDGQCYGAHDDFDGMDGDSSGKEVCLGNYWNSNYYCFMRKAS